jgi:hypothetical protein
LVGLAGCTGSSSGHAPTGHTDPKTVLPTSGAGDPYVRLAGLLHREAVDIWFETDLVASWRAGAQTFDTTIRRLARLARVPGVTGFKVADELGYGDGLTTSDQVDRFLQAVDVALRRVAPHAQILVDAIVPELGCLPWKGQAERACAEQARHDYPAATIDAFDHYLGEGVIDRLDLSTGLLDDSTYEHWGMTRDDAQSEAWAHVTGLGWSKLVTLQARKALAEAGGYPDDATQAARDIRTYVSLPLSDGAKAVDIWTWRQPYDGKTVSLLPADLAPNALWVALEKSANQGAHFFTHMTPSAMATPQRDWTGECKRVAQVFSSVFVAAGTG